MAAALDADLQRYDATKEATREELVKMCNACALHKRNDTAARLYADGKAAHGIPALLEAGLNLNALLYACCREPRMLKQAMDVWNDIKVSRVIPDTEPMQKLILSCLGNSKFDHAFNIFLAAIEAGLQPSERVCGALVRTASVQPRLAQLAYGVFLSVRGAGMRLPPKELLGLARACAKQGTLDQAVAAMAAARDAGAKIDAAFASSLVMRCAEASVPQRSTFIHALPGRLVFTFLARCKKR
eukprot:6180706-Pleurochrysis_carterae.AAC.1